MIKFIKGEDKHVKFRIHSAKGEAMIVESAGYALKRYGEVEASGPCNVINDGKQPVLDMKLYPCETGQYQLEVTYQIADETLKHKEDVKVV